MPIRIAVTTSNNVSVQFPDLYIPFDWRPYLQGCDAVIHLAGIAHIPADENTYDRINHQATERLAKAAERCGTNLIFVSSIAAQSGSFSERELSEDDVSHNQAMPMADQNWPQSKPFVRPACHSRFCDRS